MKKFLLLAAAICLTLASTGIAQESHLFFTCREYNSGAFGFRTNGSGGSVNTDIGTGATIGNPLLPANNPILYLQPVMPANMHLQGTPNPPLNDHNTAQRNFQIWMRVTEKYTGANSEELIGSLGYSINSLQVASVPPPAFPSPAVPNANRRGTVTLALTQYTTPATTNAAGTALWDGTNIVTPPVTDARAVTVPDSVGDFANGALPNAGSGSYRVSSLLVTAGGPDGNAFNSCRNQQPTRIALRLSVSPLLITRVVNPSFGGAITDEAVNFGYTGGGAPELATNAGCPVAPCGSVSGTDSATADANIEVRFKGDHNNNGQINAADTPGQYAAQAAGASALAHWLGDFVGTVPTQNRPDGQVTAADTSFYLTTRTPQFAANMVNCPGT